MVKDTDFSAGLIKVDYDKHLSQHDIVYLSPAVEGSKVRFPLALQT